jgi:hypothetical protein
MEESGGLEVSIATTTPARVSFEDHALRRVVQKALIGAKGSRIAGHSSPRLTRSRLAIFDYADRAASLNKLSEARRR